MTMRWPWSGGPEEDGAPEPGAFDPTARDEWRWTQPRAGRRRWRLAAGDRTMALLVGRGVLGTGSSARTADGGWNLRTRWRGDVVATRDGGTEPVAHFRQGWFFSGRIERPGLPSLRWRRTGFWRDRWELQTEEHQALVRFQGRMGFLRLEAAVELEDAARRLPDLPLLLALGWFLILNAHRSHSQ